MELDLASLIEIRELSNAESIFEAANFLENKKWLLKRRVLFNI